MVMEFDINECPDFGYRIASNIDQDFYTHFNISPLGLLSDCGFENLGRLGIEEGYDICIHMEEENFDCKKCKNSEQKYPWYPPITDQVVINLLIFAGTSASELPIYSGRDEDKNIIFEHVKNKCWTDNTLRDKIRDLLVGHLQEWSKM